MGPAATTDVANDVNGHSRWSPFLVSTMTHEIVSRMTYHLSVAQPEPTSSRIFTSGFPVNEVCPV